MKMKTLEKEIFNLYREKTSLLTPSPDDRFALFTTAIQTILTFSHPIYNILKFLKE